FIANKAEFIPGESPPLQITAIFILDPPKKGDCDSILPLEKMKQSNGQWSRGHLFHIFMISIPFAYNNGE
ncbi:TPA: hypothetical protein ACG8R2_001829, partial [Enterococcus faecium]